MLRGLLATYLMLVTAAGPSLCCCSAMHLIAGSPHQASCCNEVNSPLPPCCQSPHDTIQINPDDQNQTQPTKGIPVECPCRKLNAKSVTLTKHSLDLQDLTRFGLDYLLIHLDFTHDVCHTITPTKTQSDQSPAHFLTAEDLLYTHHQLRC